MKQRVLVAEPIGEEGLALLRQQTNLTIELPKDSDAPLIERIRGVSGLIIRSSSQVTEEVLAAANDLKVVVRAGTGIDNIDLNAATAKGVVVMNTPGANTNAAVEHTLALLLSLARRIPAANRSLRDGKWEREKFVGWELSGKVLGVIGLGRIGTEVVTRAQAFGVTVVAHDPFITAEAAEARSIELASVDDLLSRADIVSLHLPLTDETRGVINAAALERMKPGSHLINCARGGLIDEEALVDALDSGHIAGAAIDVFETEPKPNPRLIAHPNVVTTPHLGASTNEAKSSVGIKAAKQVIGVLDGSSFENAINIPVRDAELFTRLAPYVQLAERMATLQMQLCTGDVKELRLEFTGVIEDTTPLRLAFLRGLMSPIADSSVNYVNAPYLADKHGIQVTESRATESTSERTVLSATVVTEEAELTLRGTVVPDSGPRLIEIDGFHIDAIPAGQLLVCRSVDQPGVMGDLGNCCRDYGHNISEFRLGRNGPEGEALCLITLDSEPAPAAVEAVGKLANIISVHAVSLPDDLT